MEDGEELVLDTGLIADDRQLDDFADGRRVGDEPHRVGQVKHRNRCNNFVVLVR